MKKILKILFAIMAPAWLAFSCAHAEEIELVPTDTFSLSEHVSYSVGDPRSYEFDSLVQCPNYSGTFNWIGGDFLNSSSRIAYQDPYYSYSNSVNSKYLNLILQHYDYYSDNYTVPTFTVSITGGNVSLDVSTLLAGWYRYEADIYIGLGGMSEASFHPSFDPAFTFNATPFPLASGTLTYVGTEDYTVGASQNSLFGSKFLHFVLEDTFYIDPAVGSYDWYLDTAFANIVSGIQYQGGTTIYRRELLIITTNNRFISRLYSNVDPPITPTPTPTPSPNQDIINNNNSNTTNIITTINDGFDALSAVFEGSIYGLTDLIFGSASDWIDFFSDVQDDMEEYLPVVTFFQSCKNILANFFNVESTDPTALQYIAGWQSDIYTLHIGALPLVLPEGSFNFFPEVNFNLNNPFMNEIRPYWLTFSNVLITLLFLRYLANYLFRWTQLLTGDTSVAFQLFHHAPDELENLGTDPYDLAGDYSYDSIDSANHDLYQDAEAHYGHGAARYLSKVFHSK